LTADTIQHRLSFALRVADHFSNISVDETLDVKLDTRERPVTSQAGLVRHDDGTYRWADLRDGLREVTIASPSRRWTTWTPGPLAVSVPLADPQTAVRYEMWPTPLASAPPGVSAIRGKLLGSAVSGARIEINGTAMAPTGRYTLADAAGEFLYLLPGGPWPVTVNGALDLQITVVTRTVSGGDIAGIGSFVGAQFELPPSREMRIRFHVI